MPYICSTDIDRRHMLDAIGLDAVDDLFAVLPDRGRLPLLDVPGPLGEMELAAALRGIAGRNRVFPNENNFLGAGAYRHYVPSIVRSVAQKHEFYAPYALRYSEVHQGTLQALYEFQSMLTVLTGLDCANSSLYDGASACAEAVRMAQRITGRRKVVLAGALDPQVRDVVGTYCEGSGVPVVIAGYCADAGALRLPLDTGLLEGAAALVVQYPNFFGVVEPLEAIAAAAHAAGAKLVVHADPLALALLRSPGELGADIVVGEARHLGLPVSTGGPSLGYIVGRMDDIEQMPGAIVQVGVDEDGRRGFAFKDYAERDRSRLREAAASNIGTTATLPAVLMAAYVAALGREGLREVAALGYHRTHYLAGRLAALPGCTLRFSATFFSEVVIQLPVDAAALVARLAERGFLAGFRLETHFRELRNCLMLTASELTPRDAIDRFVACVGREIAALQSDETAREGVDHD